MEGYIKRKNVEAMLWRLSNEPFYYHNGETFFAGISAAESDLLDIPDEDVVEVRYSKWVGFPNNGVWDIKCASCHRLLPFGQNPKDLNYCPYCGARMET